MSKHTPGEWYAKREGFSTVYVFSRIGGGLVQEVAACGPTNGGVDQQEANARLIAAAPDLLEALKKLLNECEQAGLTDARDFKWPQVTSLASAAIAKAEGA